MVNFENANKALEKARTKGKDIATVRIGLSSALSVLFSHTQAESNQQKAKEKFDHLSEIGKKGM